MTHPDTSFELPPVIGKYHDLSISHAKGCYIYDTNNTPYLDFGSGIAVTSTGHCHPHVVSAIQNQAQTLIHPCIATGTYPSLKECSKKLTELFTEPYSVFFDQSGTSAIEAALKLAKHVTKKHKIIAFTGGFHGRTMGSLSVTSSKKSYQEGIGPMLEGVSFFPFPYCYRCPWDANKDTCHHNPCVNALKTSSLFTDDVAAVIIEPTLGEGGYIPAPKVFLQELAKHCASKGILLIFDEIQTGVGRTGSWFKHQQFNIVPDIVVTAKGLGSGMPIGACLAKTDIMNQWPKGAHGGTYGGNPVTCAAASATLTIVESLLGTIQPLSHMAASFLDKAIGSLDTIGDIRVDGLMIGIECVRDKESKTPFPEMAADILSMALEHRLIVLSCGIYSNVIRLAPPLIISKEELHKGLTILKQVIHDYHKR